MNPLQTVETEQQTVQLPVVQQAAESLTAAEVEELLDQLASEAEKRKQKRRLKSLLLGGYLCLVIGTFLIRFLFETKFKLELPGIWLFWVFAGIGAASQLQKDGVKRLAKSPDVRGVGHFIDALEFEDKDTVKVAAATLLTLLPQLQATDSSLLDDEQRAILYKQLRSRDIEFVLVILKALEQIGDEKSLPVVEELANRKQGGEDSRRIREAAAACMPLLRVRAEREKAAQTLLRATAETGSDSLLRPAEGAATEADHLLKPAENIHDRNDTESTAIRAYV